MSSCRNKVVIGLGFGDEGKGMFTDYLCSHTPNSLVVRFNGGHQAGHTVTTDDNRHIFSNYGSGALKGHPTYWSPCCTVDPIALIRERDILISKGFNPVIYIDQRCPITTPLDSESNKNHSRIYKHGSCGVGFGQTIEREEKFYSFTFMDIFYKNIFHEKIRMVKKYRGNDDYVWNNFIISCEKIKHDRRIIMVDQMPIAESRIFEGAQGLLLDQHYGFFPNVTRSNTGSKNLPMGPYQFYLVTRAYQTRHGNGFMTNEDIPHNIKTNPIETNVKNYQGEFRRSLLDVDLLEYGIRQDADIMESNSKSLVITCLDHIENEYRMTRNGGIINCANEYEFTSTISQFLGIRNVYLSRGANSKGVYKLKF